MPIPITTAPSIWFRPASGLRMRPASMTVTTRPTRKPGDLRLPGDLDEVTAERVRRELRLRVAERRLGLAAARDQAEVGAAEHVGERHRGRRAVGLHEDPPVLEGQLVGRSASRTVTPAWPPRRSATMRSRCRPPRRRPGPPSRSPSTRPRSDLPAATCRRAPLRSCRAAPRSSARRAAQGSCTCRSRYPACRTRHGRCHRRGAGRSPPRRIAPRSTCTRPCPSRASGRRASSSRPRGAPGPAELRRTELEAFEQMTR